MYLKTYEVLGLMSGSSLDGLDMAHVQIHLTAAEMPLSWEDLQVNITVRRAITQPFEEAWVQRLQQLPSASGATLWQTHADFGRYMGVLVNNFLAAGTHVPQIISSHGHTVFHHPEKSFTCQIGDGAALAATTGLPTVCDFRTADMALGGQGTPLAPLADRLLFPQYHFCLNIGGIMNLTANHGKRLAAFDVAPANQVLNYLAQQAGNPYDENGSLAATGHLDNQLFGDLNSLPYFSQYYPKSIDNQWIKKTIFPILDGYNISIANKLRTYVEHIAYQLALSVKRVLLKEELGLYNAAMIVTGGGAFNQYLIHTIQRYANKILPIDVIVPDPELIQFKEAILMGLLGVLRLELIPNVFATVTGAKKDTIGGAIYAA